MQIWKSMKKNTTILSRHENKTIARQQKFLGFKKKKLHSLIVCAKNFRNLKQLYQSLKKLSQKFPPHYWSSTGQSILPNIYLLSSQNSGEEPKVDSSTRPEPAFLFGPIAPFLKLRAGNDKKNTLGKEYSRLCGIFLKPLWCCGTSPTTIWSSRHTQFTHTKTFEDEDLLHLSLRST